MATTDINGMVFYSTSDLVTPLAANINAISTATTNAFNSMTRTFRVANQAARDALLTARGASASAPLQVDRADTGNIERNTGAGWTPAAWQSWTPTPSANIAFGGAPTVSGRYHMWDNTVDAYFSITLGSSPSVLTSPRITLPVPALSGQSGMLSGQVSYFQPGVAEYLGSLFIEGGNTSFGLYRFLETLTSITPTTPFTFAAGAIIHGRLTYEAA